MIDLFKIELFKIQEDETAEQYIDRLCTNKEYYELTWKEITELITYHTGIKKDESSYRRKYKNRMPENTQEAVTEPSSTEEVLSELILQIKKEQVKLADERTQNQAYIRRIAREETIKDLAIEAADKMESKKLLYIPKPRPTPDSKRKGVLQLSDWHIGLEIDNYKNKYSPDEAMRRLDHLRDQVIELITENKIDELWVADLGDLICGRIHLPLRIQSRMDVISQEILVSELLAELLTDLSNYCVIHYYSVTDNHSRIEPVKDSSLQLETLARIHPWYLKQRLRNNENIEICDNPFDESVTAFEIFDWCFAGVHGDKDKPKDVVNNIVNLTWGKFDVILTAHLHHFASEEDYDTVVISNGSLMGVDDYAYNLRKFSAPTQNFIVVTENNPVKYIARILV